MLIKKNEKKKKLKQKNKNFNLIFMSQTIGL